MPPKSTMATVVVSIERNLFKPRFKQPNIDLDVLENHPLGDPLLTVEATDEDDKVNADTVLPLAHIMGLSTGQTFSFPCLLILHFKLCNQRFVTELGLSSYQSITSSNPCIGQFPKFHGASSTFVNRTTIKEKRAVAYARPHDQSG